MSPLKAIEHIAKSDDRARAITFFLFFARFEYALKRAGFVRDPEQPKADWDEYARRQSDLLDKNTEVQFRDAVAYLKKSPPKKQVISQHGELGWSDDRFSGPLDLSRVFILVRRVRNNLFHGEKFPIDPEGEFSRDRKLL